MMSQSELDVSTATPNGFWEIGNYKANIQRINQGSEQLEDITRFIKDRMAIENNYSKQLERWNDEWQHYSEKCLKEGSIKRSFGLLLEEGHELSRVHQTVKERFNDEVLKTIELFKRDNYHKTAFRGFKEAKEIEDEFEKAQKQWKKLFEKVEIAKKNYHVQMRAEKSAYIQFLNSKADQSIADCANDKSKEKFEKCQEELKKAKSNYEQQLKEITAYNSIYIESMTFVFQKCQRIEMKRLRFVVEMLSGMQKIMVDLLNPTKLQQIHAKLRQYFLDTSDATLGEDLKKWSMTHGVDSTTKWPEFEEYIGDFRHIHNGSNKTKQRNQLESGSTVVLTKKVLKADNESTLNGKDDIGIDSLPRRNRLNTGSSQKSSEKSLTPNSSSNCSFVSSQLIKDSFDSSQLPSRTTSTKSTRSQSEKPHRNQCGSVPKQFQIQYQQHATLVGKTSSSLSKPSSSILTSTSTSIDDPLATSQGFPMVTPQKMSDRTGDNNERAGKPTNIRNNITSYESRHKNGKAISKKLPEQEQLQNQMSTTQCQLANNNGIVEHNNLMEFSSPQMPTGPAKVLYDYAPGQDDEILLTKGEILDVLSGPDHLGWCLGVKKNKERGLFPASYVLPLINQDIKTLQ